MAKATLMNSRPGLVILAMLLLVACESTRFVIYDDAPSPTHGAMLANRNNIERTAVNAFQLTGPSKIGFRSPAKTDLLFSTEIIRSTSDPITIQVRTTPYDDSLLARPGLVVTIAGDSTRIVNGSDSSVFHTPLPVNKPFLVELRNDGAWIELGIGHTVFGHQRCRLPNTEWVLIGLPSTGSILVGDPQFIFGF